MKCLFPTPVGVFLNTQIGALFSTALPHARGGVSNDVTIYNGDCLSSPRPWGCFWATNYPSGTKSLFPTPVGVFRQRERTDGIEFGSDGGGIGGDGGEFAQGFGFFGSVLIFLLDFCKKESNLYGNKKLQLKGVIMYRNGMTTEIGTRSGSAIATLLTGVYYWMTFALGISALCAWAVGTTPALTKLIFQNPILTGVLIFAELGLVIAVSWGINKMSAATATALFAFYAALNGITLGTIFLIYSLPAITAAFATTAGTFAVMAVYGSVTKRDLSKFGSILFMGLLGLIIASIVNIFLRSSGLDWIITYAGVLIFVGLTAYDAQKIKHLYIAMGGDVETNKKIAVLGALTLYLDFVNLFLYLLRIFGGKRN